jgi:hypothetical protein
MTKGIIKNVKELGVKGFMDKWKDGILKLSPEELLKAKISGSIGSIAGIILAMIFFIFVYQRLWTIGIIMFFSLFIQGSQLIEFLQQKKVFEQMSKDLISYKDLMEGEE